MQNNALPVIIAGAVTLLAGAIVPVGIEANHQWGKYKWAADGQPIELAIGDNTTTTAWGTALDGAMDDWDGGTPDSLDLDVVASIKNPATCDPTLGRIEVCNDEYGNNGWLGIAQIWVQRPATIVQATTRVNDTYFNTPKYNTTAWRRFVMCQEVGHDFGLDHQDENFDNANLGSCMDYTSDPDGSLGDPLSNLSPNQHDWDQLASMYLSSGGGGGGGGGGRPGGPGGGRGSAPGNIPDDFPDVADQRVPMDSPGQWGQLVKSNGRVALYDLDLGFGNHVFTFVVWAN
jgi:hypothetical protein